MRVGLRRLAEAVRRMRMTAWRTTEGSPRRGRTLFPHAQFIDLQVRF